jgi:undecaprenyl pyrophosphate phosphatase UppP
MARCHRCGAKLDEDMLYCPNCGSKVRARYKEDFRGFLIGGIILLFSGLIFYLQVTGSLRAGAMLAIILIAIGLLIICTKILSAKRRAHQGR